MLVRLTCSSLLLAVLGTIALLASSAAPAGAVIVSPAPGTPDASPATQISLLGVRPGRIRSVRVRGSLSGLHSGRLRAYSGGRGASFVLWQALQSGERVAVRVGIRGREPLAFAFTVARLAPTPP